MDIIALNCNHIQSLYAAGPLKKIKWTLLLNASGFESACLSTVNGGSNGHSASKSQPE